MEESETLLFYNFHNFFPSLAKVTSLCQPERQRKDDRRNLFFLLFFTDAVSLGFLGLWFRNLSNGVCLTT